MRTKTCSLLLYFLAESRPAQGCRQATSGRIPCVLFCRTTLCPIPAGSRAETTTMHLEITRDCAVRAPLKLYACPAGICPEGRHCCGSPLEPGESVLAAPCLALAQVGMWHFSPPTGEAKQHGAGPIQALQREQCINNSANTTATVSVAATTTAPTLATPRGTMTAAPAASAVRAGWRLPSPQL